MNFYFQNMKILTFLTRSIDCPKPLNLSLICTGANCSQNYNACSDNPCAIGQNCTDMTPEQQGNMAIGYTCGPCPDGYEKRNISNTLVCSGIILLLLVMYT